MNLLEYINTNLDLIKNNASRVYNKGKFDERNNIWYYIQRNGTYQNYSYAFYANKWNYDNFYPLYNFNIGDGTYMFYYFNNDTIYSIMDLSQRLEDQGVEWITNGLTGCTSMFEYSKIDNIPEINVTNSSITSLLRVFYGCSNLTTIKKLILRSDGSQTFGNTFYNCSNLENIVIEGVIGNTLSLSSCTKLSGDSIESFIDALSDTASRKTITFSRTAVNNATFTSGNSWSDLVDSKSNWTISLA